jgi:hypothetical protein
MEAEKERKHASADAQKQRQKTETGFSSVSDPKMFSLFMKHVTPPTDPTLLSGEVGGESLRYDFALPCVSFVDRRCTAHRAHRRSRAIDAVRSTSPTCPNRH